MRTALLFGLLLGILQMVGTLGVYAFGLHSSPDTLEGAYRIESLAAFIAMMASLCLGLRAIRLARRRQGLASTFRDAAQATLVIASVGGAVTALGQYLYFTVLNPAYSGHLRTSYLRAAQLSAEQAEAYARQLDFATSASFHVLKHSATTFFFSILVGLVYAFLFRDRPAPSPTARS